MSALAEQLRRRDAALRACRAFFHGQGFLEVETPMLTGSPGLEPHIDPLEVSVRTALDAAPAPRWLHTSPEIALKRVLAALAREGSEGRVFQLARVFRDGEHGPLHRPEFTMLEWYRAPGTLEELMADALALGRALGEAIGCEGIFDAALERTTVSALFAERGIDLGAALDVLDREPTRLSVLARAAGFHVPADASFEDAFFLVMDKIEPELGQTAPVVVERYPRSMAVLARLCEDDPRYAARFELYAHGIELANAFDELTDGEEQRRRFEEDNAERRRLGKPALPIDEAFLADIDDLPRSAGIALGFDRLVLALLGASDLERVVGYDAW